MIKVKNKPLKWHGGKTYLSKWLHSLAPPSVIDDPENGYITRGDAYFGAGNASWEWLPTDDISEVVNDINEDLANFWNVLRTPSQFDSLTRKLEATPFSKPLFDEMLNSPAPSCPVDQAFRFFVINRQSMSGRMQGFTPPTKLRTRGGRNAEANAWWNAIEGLREVHERLQGVLIYNEHAPGFIRIIDSPKTLVYCDPPYMHETRSTTSEYGEHEMSDRAHAILLATLATQGRMFISRDQFETLSGDETYEDFVSSWNVSFRGRFMLSGYWSQLYEDFANELGWKRHEFEIDNKASSAKTKEKKTECVWTNY
jgi:DNA adenine methylase